MELSPGASIQGKYTITRVLGEGGMGVVYQARHEELGSLVAIKVLRSEVLADREAVTRFAREAKAAAMLDSDHIARVLDVGKLPDERPFMVMEFLEGKDLGQELDVRRQLPVAEAVDLVIQACEAMQIAHSRGIVHRDLKPANLFLVRTAGRTVVKLVDFGVSRIGGPNNVRVTQTTTAFGTPLYMSPEALRSAKLADTRSDIWALGVILYELLVGIPPFLGDSPTAVGVAITVDKQKPVCDIRPDVPRELDAIIAWTLEKDPSKRPQSAEELAEALRPFRDRMPLPPRSIPGASVIPEAIDGPTRIYAGSHPVVRTGTPTSRDVNKEKKRSRTAIFVVSAAAGLGMALGIGVFVATRKPAAGAAQPSPVPDGPVAPATGGPALEVAPTASVPEEPAPRGAAAPTGTAIDVEDIPSAGRSAAPAIAAKDPAGPPPTRSPTAPEGPATAAPKPPASAKPKTDPTTPKNPGGNPFVL